MEGGILGKKLKLQQHPDSKENSATRQQQVASDTTNQQQSPNNAECFLYEMKSYSLQVPGAAV